VGKVFVLLQHFSGNNDLFFFREILLFNLKMHQTAFGSRAYAQNVADTNAMTGIKTYQKEH